MPKIGQPIRKQPVIDDDRKRVQDGLELRREFLSPKYWTRSAKGNLWRRWDERTVCVFRAKDGRFGWSIASGDDVRYSSTTFGNEPLALTDLWFEAEVKYW